MSSVLHTTLDTQRREIRLLALLPGECTDPVSCQLHIDSLDREPLYEALSYVWGDSNEHRTILLDETEFPVTDNLYAALRRLRNRREKRVIWVDQLCINQSDLVERGHQVGLMESVYSKTFRALFWLAD
ncbi:heterokaryon incompatibility protein-domain-containing protein, partial [Clohesyomyces aquaticus]